MRKSRKGKYADFGCRPSIVWRKIGQQGPREVARGNALFEVVMMVTVVVVDHKVVLVVMAMVVVMMIVLLGAVSGSTGRRHLCLFGFQSCWGGGGEGPGPSCKQTQMRSKNILW